MSVFVTNSGNRFVYLASTPSTPLTLSTWVNFTDLSADRPVMGIYGSQFYYHQISTYVADSNKFAAVSRANAPERRALSTTVATTGVWFHVAGVFSSATAREIYVNGASEGVNATSAVVTSQVFVPGMRSDTNGGYAMANAHFAHVAVYTSALAASQIASLAAGASPLVVSPDSLWCYGPMIKANGLVNLKGSPFLQGGTNDALFSSFDPPVFPP